MPLVDFQPPEDDESDRLDGVIPSPLNPDYECVPVASQTPDGRIPAGPPGASRAPEPVASICPDGYVPRRKQRRRYELDGKIIVAPDDVAERNPSSGDDQQNPNLDASK